MKEDASSTVIDIHRSVSIELLQSVHCFAMRTPRGQKDPGAIHWDPRTNSIEKSKQTIETLKKTEDNPAIHLFGSTVDVDVDTDNPFLSAALDWFLPETPHVWGRASRPRSHRLYELKNLPNNQFDPLSYSFLAQLQKRKDLALEVRGGDMRSGRYTLLPGALHPSGEKYEWENANTARSTPVMIDGDKLMTSIRYAAVAAIMAPYWTEGTRNTLCMCLSGFMHRATQYSDEMDVSSPFEKEDAWGVIECVMEIADDDPADFPSRRKTFDQTWEKADEGQPVAGATRIKEITGDETIVQYLYGLLAHTSELQQLDEFFERYVMLRNSSSVIDLQTPPSGTFLMDRQAFLSTLAGHYVTTPRGKVAASHLLLNSKQRTVVDFITSRPDEPSLFEESGVRYANVWTGWGIDPYPDPVTDDDVRPFLNYLGDVISRGDAKIMEWVLGWLSHIFQAPLDKPGTALVLVGQYGAGKSLLGEQILRPIIGFSNTTKVGSVEKLTSRFNSHMAGKLLIQGEEVMSVKRRADANMLKDLITSTKRSIELKGRDVFEMDDFARYIFTSNHIDDAVAVEAFDRRYTILEVSDEYSARRPAQGKKYWTPFWQWLEESPKKPHRENLSKIHRYLKDYDADVELVRMAVSTEAKRRTQDRGAHGLDKWLLSVLEWTTPLDNLKEEERGYEFGFVIDKNGKFELTRGWPQYIPYSLLEASVKRHAGGRNELTRTSQQLAYFFKGQGLVETTEAKKVRINGKRIKIRPFPKRETIASYLRDLGYSVDEEHDDDEVDTDEGADF